MKFFVQNRKNLLFATLMAASFGLNAQIESTHTDVKYGYTTVVYKDKAAPDSDVLSALDNSIGMGDVVRVTIAPPKPVAVPNVDKSKGEDTWLKPAVKPAVITMTASAAAAPVNNVMLNTAAPNTNAAPAAALNAAPVAPKPVAEKVVAVPAENLAAANIDAEQNSAAKPAAARVARSAESIKAAKSANKSLKKGKSNFKKKSRKKGKQRYKCPKF